MKIQLKVLNKEFYQHHRRIYGGCEVDEYIGLPAYATSGSAAIDLVCTEDVTIYPGGTKAIHTGLAIWIGGDVAALILPRSGLGTKGLVLANTGLALANTAGLIDKDYQGELIVQMWNRNESIGWESFYEDEEAKTGWLGKEIFDKNDSKDNAITIKAGERFAQLMFIPVVKAQFVVVEEFSETSARGDGGFGSTGA